MILINSRGFALKVCYWSRDSSAVACNGVSNLQLRKCILFSLQDENDFIKTRAYTNKVSHCLIGECNRSREIGSGFGVRLDFRRLRTPQRKLFIVPRELLAVGVAQEWAAQHDVIVPSHMHLVGTLGY